MDQLLRHSGQDVGRIQQLLGPVAGEAERELLDADPLVLFGQILQIGIQCMIDVGEVDVARH